MPPSAGVASADGGLGGDSASKKKDAGSSDGHRQAKRALARIGAALGVSDPSHPQSRLQMLRRFQALDADGSGILSSAELIDGKGAGATQGGGRCVDAAPHRIPHQNVLDKCGYGPYFLTTLFTPVKEIQWLLVSRSASQR
jgi:hypothetical protein